MTSETIFTSPLSATAQIGDTTGCQDTVHGRVQAPLATPSSELRSEGAEYAKASLGIVAGVCLTLAVEVWVLVDMGFIRRRDPQAAEKAVAAAYWDETYSKIAVNPQDEER